MSVSCSGASMICTLYITFLVAACTTTTEAFSRQHGNRQMTETAATDEAASRTIISPVIDLQLHTSRESPADFLSSLAKECRKLDIDSFDLYGDFSSDANKSYLRRFEEEVASQFGKEDAVYCLSGGMAQCIVLAINARKQTDSSVKTQAFACHPTSHLLLHERNNFHELLGMEAIVLNHSPNGMRYNPDHLKEFGCYDMEPIRLSHVKIMFASIDGAATSDKSTTSTYSNSIISMNDIDLSTLILELPHRKIGGKLTPWSEVEEIASVCYNHDVKLHCDGARIFEASAGYGHKSLKQTAQPFSSVYISFYKGLGNGIGGAMLLGDRDFCEEARIWLRRFGGNLYSVLPYAVASWAGWRKNCAHAYGKSNTSVFDHRQKKLARVIKLLQADSTISSVVKFDPILPQTNMVHGYIKVSYDECIGALNKVEERTGIRVLSRLRRCKDVEFGCRFEWVMGESNSMVDDDTFVSGWDALARVFEQ